MNEQSFERDRLQLFQEHGFAGTSTWLPDATGGRTYAITRGRGACPTLLVHGGMAEASVWYRMAPHLAGPVAIVDRPGHGLTSAVDYASVDYRHHTVAWMASVVDGLGAEQVDLVGNSMGGYFSVVFALAYPARVRRLVLAGAPAGMDRALPLFLRLWGRPVIGHALSALMKLARDPAQLRARVLAPMTTHPERVSDAACRVALAAAHAPSWHPTMRAMVRAVSDLGGWRPALSIREAMRTLAVPTLFAWGDQDNFAPPASALALAPQMPDAHAFVLDDAGHLPQLDQPEALARCIRDFFQTSSPAQVAL